MEVIRKIQVILSGKIFKMSQKSANDEVGNQAGNDLKSLLKYLFQHKVFIGALTAVPVLLFLLYGLAQKKSYRDNQVATIIKMNQSFENLNTRALFSEKIIQEALQKSGIPVDPQEVFSHLTIVVGFDRINNPIDIALEKLAGEISISRTENLAEIKRRFDNLLTTQNNFYTIYYNLENSVLDVATAKILVSEIINTFNQEFENGMVYNAPNLSEVDLSSLENLTQATPFALSQLKSLLVSLEEKTKALTTENYSKRGFNPEMLISQMRYIDLQLSSIISTSPELQKYFDRDLNRDISVTTKKIQSIDRALDLISDKKGGLSPSYGSDGNNSIKADYNSELFERFLNVGASLSLVEFQKTLLDQKLELEFRKSELEQQKTSFAEIGLDPDEVDELYTQMLEETKELARSLNQFITDFAQSYQKRVVSLVNQKLIRSAGIFQPRPLLQVLTAAFGLAVSLLAIRFSLTAHKS